MSVTFNEIMSFAKYLHYKIIFYLELEYYVLSLTCRFLVIFLLGDECRRLRKTSRITIYPEM